MLFFFRMYCSGLNPNIEMLYNPINFPVSSNTPPLHTLCSWNHEEEWSIIDVAVLVCIDEDFQILSSLNKKMREN